MVGVAPLNCVVQTITAATTTTMVGPLEYIKRTRWIGNFHYASIIMYMQLFRLGKLNFSGESCEQDCCNN